jgi:hypothetical protein
MVDALEAYLRVTAPSGTGVSPLEGFASAIAADIPSPVDENAAEDELPDEDAPARQADNAEPSGPAI